MAVASHFLRSGLAAVVTMVAVASATAQANGSLSDDLKQKIATARLAETRKQFDLAVSLYGQAIETEGASPGKRLLLKRRASVYERINMMDRAEADLTMALSVEPLDPRSYADRGYFYLRRNRFAAALDDFVIGLRFDPQNPLYLFGAARVLVAVEDFTSAVKFYDQAIRLAPNDPRLYLARAEAEVHLKLMRAAQADYDKALTLGLNESGDRYFAFAGRGYVHLVLANYDGAISDLDRALDINTDAPKILLLRGHAYERQGRHDLALHDYEQASAAMPENVAARLGVQRLRSQ